MKHKKLLTFFAMVMVLVSMAGMGNAATLTSVIEDVIYSENLPSGAYPDLPRLKEFPISLYPGKTSYYGHGEYGAVSGDFDGSPGTVFDYVTVKNGNGTLAAFEIGAQGSLGRVGVPTAASWGGREGWCWMWTASDPDTEEPDFKPHYVAKAKTVTGTVNITGLKSGIVYFCYGGYRADINVDVTLSGPGLADVTLIDAGATYCNNNEMMLCGVEFTNEEGYTTLSYETFSSQSSAGRSRYLLTVLDGLSLYEPEIIYPSNGELVDPGAVNLQWGNPDPNGAAVTYANVLFGTDPCELTPLLPAPADVNDVTTDPLAPGKYYWQVVTYAAGYPGPSVSSDIMMFTNDAPVESVELAAPQQITWLGEPIGLAANVVDDGGTPLTYTWTVVPDGSADPNITVSLVPDAGDPSIATLTVTNLIPDGTMLPVTVTVEVVDVTNTDAPVSASVVIDVHDDECLAARNGLGIDAIADYNLDCKVIGDDLATLIGNWLVDYSATEFAREAPGPALAGEIGVLDVTGINPATGQPWAAGDQYRLAFVTSATMQATEPNIATYDAFVQGLADAAGLGGATWRCVGAAYGTGESNYNLNRDINVGRMSPDVPALLVDGATVLWNEFLNGNPLTTYSMTETGGSWLGNVATGAGRLLGDPGQTNIERGDSNRTDGAWWRVYNGSQTSQWHFYAVSDPLTVIVPVCDAGDKISTWLGEPVTMDPTVGDPNDPTAVFDYSWEATAAEWLEVAISDPAVEEPTVTITRPYAWYDVPVLNPSFEDRETFDPFPEATDKYFQWGKEAWRQFEVDNNGGPMRIWNPGVLGVDETTQGLADVAFGGNAPDGKYIGVVYTRYNDNEMELIRPVRDWEALTQIVEDDKFVFNPEANYILTVKVGRLPEGPEEGGSINFNWDTSDPDPNNHAPRRGWYGYTVQLVAGGTNVGGATYAGHVIGGTVIAEDANSIEVAPNTFATSTVTYVPGSADASLAGLPLQIRLCALENPNDHSMTSYAAFDDVKLTTDAPLPVEPVTMTLTVNKQGDTETVSDKVTIDLYENACEMGKTLDPESIDVSDHNLDCITNMEDFADLAAEWLLDYALTAPAARP